MLHEAYKLSHPPPPAGGGVAFTPFAQAGNKNLPKSVDVLIVIFSASPFVVIEQLKGKNE